MERLCIMEGIERKESKTMSSKHYEITAKGKYEEIKNPDGSTDVKIYDVTKVNLNGNETFNELDFNKGKTSVIFNIFMFGAAILSLVLVISFIIGEDIFNIDKTRYHFSSDIVTASGLLMTIFSFATPKRRFLNKMLLFNRTGNTLLLLVFILCYSLLVAAILFSIGLDGVIANLISFICVIISFISLLMNHDNKATKEKEKKLPL